MKNLILSAVGSALGAALVLLIVFYSGGVKLGANASNEFYTPVVFKDEVSIGSTCGSKSYTIPALSPKTSAIGASWATTTVTVTGAALGDVASVSNNSSTNALLQYGVFARASISSANTATVIFSNETLTTSTAVTTATLKVCYFDTSS